MLAKVFYNVAEGDRFWKFSPDTSALHDGFFVVVEDDEDVNKTLGRIWRAGNRVDGSAEEQVPDGKRSLSSGDVIVLVNGAGILAYAVDPFGWTQLEIPVVNAALLRGRALPDPFAEARALAGF